jgi:signal transduction histidine kinase
LAREELQAVADQQKSDGDQPGLAGVLSKLSIPGSNLQHIGRNLARELKQSMRIDWAAIAFADYRFEGEARAVFRPFSPDISSEWDLEDTRPLTGTPLEWVTNNRRPLEEVDLRERSLFQTGPALVRKGIVSTAYVPLFAHGAVFGCLIVGSSRPDAYNRWEIEVLKRAATKLAMVADTYRLVEESRISAHEEFSGLLDAHSRRAEDDFATFLREGQDQRDDQALISDLVRILRFSEQLSQSFPTFASRLRNRVPFDHLSFASIQGEKVFIHLSSPDNTPPKAGDIYLLKDCAASWIVEHMRTHIVGHIAAEKQFPLDELYVKQRMRSVIRLPLINRDGVFATLNLATAKINAYGPTEQRFLEELCAQLSPTSESITLRHRESERMEFLTSISHEAKTPLTSIVSSAELLAEEMAQSADSPQGRLIENIVNSAERMKSRILQFVELAAIESVDFKLPTEPVYIGTLLREAAEGAAATAKGNSQSLKVQISPDLPQIRAHPQRLKQVITTLLNNALTFSPQGGAVTLRATRYNGHVRIEVQDSGDGFSAAEQEELFKPYHPITDRKRFPELSLDLAIAKQLVELHGGTLRMDSEVGRGSTFTFALPVIAQHQA